MNIIMSKKSIESLKTENKKVFSQLLVIKTPDKILEITGREDPSAVEWFELLFKLYMNEKLMSINGRYRLTYLSPYSVHGSFCSDVGGMIIEHKQDGTLVFAGRLSANCAENSDDTTMELFNYFCEVIEIKDESVMKILNDYGVRLKENKK